MTAPYLCPGCGGGSRTASVTFPESVFTLNYLYRTPEEAIAAPGAPLPLAECAGCGLVHIPADVPEHSRYDEAYENTQEHSAAFQEHLRDVRDMLGQHLRGGQPCRVLEVGCGKGGFLRLLGETEGWSGDGYDTTYAGPPTVGNLLFHRQYVTPATVVGQHYDLVVCRHVVEHIPRIGGFLRLLAELVQCTGARRLLLETPDFGWIVDNGAFWDVFHEHRNYFLRETLACLCELAGLRLLEHRTTFDGQYQDLLLERATVPRETAAGNPPRPPVLGAFNDVVNAKIARVAGAVREAAGAGKWAIWGAGAKGVCLANHLERAKGISPSAVFDINPAKQGFFLPGRGTPILAPTGDALRAVSAVVVVNPAYAAEIAARIAAADVASTKMLVLQ